MRMSVDASLYRREFLCRVRRRSRRRRTSANSRTPARRSAAEFVMERFLGQSGGVVAVVRSLVLLADGGS